MRRYDSIGLLVGEILIPAPGVDLEKWAVVACDQYTSEPEYWQSLGAKIGDAPSTLRLIFPEVYLADADGDERIETIRSTMESYAAGGVLVGHDGLILIDREEGGHTRCGLMVSLDLDAYDYSEGSKSLIRATEGTIVDRLPPRIRVRDGAPMELPHIMVLLDDPDDTVMSAARAGATELYETPLLAGGGRLRGHAVSSEATERVAAALEQLADPKGFSERYSVPADEPVLLYAMGDGNHSLATAKAIWERLKSESGDQNLSNHPARFALVELVNLHDDALEFEPIHRVLFKAPGATGLATALTAALGEATRTTPVDSFEAMTAAVDAAERDGSGRQLVGVVSPDGLATLEFLAPTANLAVGSLQNFLDAQMEQNWAGEIDYVHGSDTLESLGTRAGNLGFYLPVMGKHDLFPTVIADGALPRKTFSMGEAHQKRFYFEARAIR
ncbi:MAG: hypothetical protein ACI9OJ_004187 [Myxococcota bacterium]